MVWGLAWPVSVGMLGLMGMSVVDTLMVGHLGAVPMAAVALGTSWYFALAVVALGALRALDPVIAQAHGARDVPAVGRGILHGCAMALAMAPVLIGLQFLAVPGMRFLGQPEALLGDAGVWCRTAAWGVPGMMLFSAIRQSLQGLGIQRPVTIAIVVANVVNLVADAVLIYGFDMGPFGAALATAGSQYVLAGLTLWMARDTLAPYLVGWRASLSGPALLGLFAIGLPLGVQMAMEAWAFHFAGLMMGWLGPTSIAANAVVLNLATVSFMVPMGVSAAASTRVGHLIGAGLPWAFAGRTALLLGGGIMGGSALAFALLPDLLARVYTDDPAVIALVVTLLPIVAAFQLFDGLQVVAFGVLRGAGDLRLPALANLLGYWALGIPLGWWLAFRAGWGAPGIFAGLALALATVAMLLLARVAWMARAGGVRVRMA
ncbi:MAG: MATE family efflux transporter [Pseudomonadota bacterium]|nr:MATE family efflux transporter [Pseudomonadota bacterium]